MCLAAISFGALSYVIQAIDATKADGYLSRLNQFWLDVMALLTAIIEEGKLITELAMSATQTILVLMGNAHQHMAQERCKCL